MTDPVYAFRTAVGGFHKGDVIAYLTREAQAHSQALAEKNQALEGLQRALEEKNQALEQAQRALEQARKGQDNPQILEEKPGEGAKARRKGEEDSPKNQEKTQEVETIEALPQELLAYRRAEAMERRAAQRVRGLYGQLDEILRQSAQSAGSACQDTKAHLTQAMGQLAQLEGRVTALFEGLEKLQSSLEELQKTVPDPGETAEEAGEC